MKKLLLFFGVLLMSMGGYGQPCLSEGFDNGISAPSGWVFNSIGGTYVTSGNYGVASPSIKLDATIDCRLSFFEKYLYQRFPIKL